jgi:hypothetical protein
MSNYDTIGHDSVLSQKVHTTLLIASSPCHTDCRIGQAEKEKKIVGHVMFLFLNDNDDTFFKHGEEIVPVVAGNLVTFPGDVPHSTIVNSGGVYLLGPFDERFSSIAPDSMVHEHQKKNRFIRQRKLETMPYSCTRKAIRVGLALLVTWTHIIPFIHS